MPPIATCPDPDRLEQFLLGLLPEQESARVEEHLPSCAVCAATLQGLHGDDPFIETMRSGASLRLPRETAVEEMMSRLRCLRGSKADMTTGYRGGDGMREAARSPVEQALELLHLVGPAQAADEIGRLGGYRILCVLGAGGMGVVFEAEDVRLQRQVALKVMKRSLAEKPQARERFLREARSAARLRSDHVVTIYQVGEDNGVPFLAMELLRGEALDQRLLQHPRPPLPELLRLAREMAAGLAAAHEHGLVHRDVKPANIWLEAPTGRVKLLDFGLARAVADGPLLTQHGTLLGTPAYMAPEQAAGGPVDARADLFSLGCVLYQLATGQLPFAGETTMAVLTALATRSPRPVQELNASLPRGLAELIMRLLAKDPADRPQQAAAVVEALQVLEADQRGGGASSCPTVGRGRRWKRASLAVLLLAALLPVGFLWGGAIVRFAANKAVLVVEVNSDDVEVVVKQDGVQVRSRTTQREFVLTAGDGEVEVYEKASGMRLTTRKFTLTRGGKETVRVRLDTARAGPAPLPPPKPAPPDKPEVKPAADADRRAAEWVLSVGGVVYVPMAGVLQNIHDIKALPAGELRVTAVHLGKADWSDAGLANLKGLNHLTHLYLDNPRFSDAGLTYLAALPNLEHLLLGTTQVSDAGLTSLKALPRLVSLDLSHTRVSDAGLAHLKALPGLNSVMLNNTRVSDAGLVHLKGMPRLEILGLNSTRVSDTGLVDLVGLPNLGILQLGDTAIGDGGLKTLKGFKGRGLALQGTQISDAGLEYLKGNTQLFGLFLGRTRVGDAGLRHLEPLLPGLTGLKLDYTQISDAGLAVLGPAKLLAVLDLTGTQVSDAGLKHLEVLTGLRELGLAHTRITDAAIASLSRLPRLQQLDLTHTRLSIKGYTALTRVHTVTSWSEPNRVAATKVLALGGVLHIRLVGDRDDRLHKPANPLPDEYFRLTRASLAGVKQPLDDLLPLLAALTDPTFDALGALDLSGTPVADVHLKSLGSLTNLSDLSLAHTGVTSEGVKHLHGLSGLRKLNLTGNKVSAAGIAALRKAVPKCHVVGGPEAE